VGVPARTNASWQWWAIAAIAGYVVIGGWIGFVRYFAQQGEVQSPWHLLYLTIQLFVLQSGAVSGPIPPELNAARFLAPVVPGWAAVRALVVVFGDQLLTLRARRMRDHVVVCGLGRKGLEFARDFRAHGESVIAIELDAENDLVRTCRASGVPVMIGDATDESLLRAVRVDRAKYVIAICGDDGTNVEVALLVRRLAGEHRRAAGAPVHCFVQVVNLRLSSLLEGRCLLRRTGEGAEVSIFNPYSMSARWLLNTHPLDYQPIREDDPRAVHLVVIGFGQMGESIALQAAAVGCYANRSKLSVTVIDREAGKFERSLLARLPGLEGACTTTFVAGDIGDPAVIERVCRMASDASSLTSIAVCLDDESRSLSCALDLRARLGGKIPVFVRMADDAGLATLLECEEKQNEWAAGIHVFGVISQFCGRGALLHERLDALAEALHKRYVRQRTAEGRPASDPSVQPWVRLDESLRNSCRQQADHIPVKLRAIGCFASDVTSGGTVVTSFTDAEVELMSRMEHARWCAERVLAGWTAGPRDHEKRTTPYLVPWFELAEDIKEYDREFVRAIPEVLGEVGESVYRANGR
jgi:voltage-gated potassium channel Kch